MAVNNQRTPLRVVGSEQVVATYAITPEARERLESEVCHSLLVALHTREDLLAIGRDYSEDVDRCLRLATPVAVKAAWRAERNNVERFTRTQIENGSDPDMARAQELLWEQRERLRKQATDSAREHLREVLQAARYKLARTADKRTQGLRRNILIAQVTAGVALLVSAGTWIMGIGAGHW
jgi:hypothetical protein